MDLKFLNEEKAFKNTVAFYKDCLGIQNHVYIICDASYFQYLSKVGCNHRALWECFGAEYIQICTARCVVEELRTRVKSDPTTYSDNVILLGHSTYQVYCPHHFDAIDSRTCIEGAIKRAVDHPFLLATMKLNKYKKPHKRTGVPFLTLLFKMNAMCCFTHDRRRSRNFLGAKKEVILLRRHRLKKLIVCYEIG